MYDIIKELLDAIWSTLEPVGYIEGRLKFRGESISEELELYERYGEITPELSAKIYKDAITIIENAIKKYKEEQKNARD